jgi:hypothetical protein
MISRHGLDSFISIRKESTDYVFFQQNITKALFDENIYFYHKYNKQVHLEQKIHIAYLKVFLYPQFKTKLTYLQKIYSTYYSFIKSYRFSSDGFNMGRLRYHSFFLRLPWEFESNLKYHGYNLKWDVPQELYKGNLQSDYSIQGLKYKNIY